MATFGERFKELRVKKNLTQQELADDFNKKYHYTFGKSAVSQYENNKRIPEIDALQNFADYFCVSIDYLMGKTDIPNPYIPEEYKEKYKITKRDLNQYEEAINSANAFFMDDRISEEDKEKFFKDISELFWDAKEKNKKKYGRKK